MPSQNIENRVWVEISGDLIVARLRGSITEQDVADAQPQVLLLLAETNRSRVLYDVLELEPPSVDLTLAQRENSDQLYRKGVRIAILVPNTRSAYLARLAFGQGDYHVIYNDLAQAVTWLMQEEA